MRVTISGGSGLIGAALAEALRARGDEVTVLSRSGEGGAIAWDPLSGPAPAQALEGREAVVSLAGEPIAQRWTDATRQAIRRSRLEGTANLVAGIEACSARPAVLVGASAVGYYGDRGDEALTEDAAPGPDFLAQLCLEWERAALDGGARAGLRACVLRTGVVLDRRGGALAKMLPPFRLGAGGPVAGGRQFMSWIALADLVAMYTAAVDDERWSGAFNATGPAPVRNGDFARSLGRALHRPAFAPVPAAALRLLYGEMAQIVTDSQNALPARALELGFEFRYGELDAALRAALS
ncbi:MAG TPA: TIGR01777 family oxidoreductase [Solirubrobacteraceae bacterium]